MRQFISEKLLVLNAAQKQAFLDALPQKVYKTERNISIVVVFTQLIMICLFLINQQLSFDNPRRISFFLLYIFLLVATVIAIFSYRHTYLHHRQKAFLWTRRIYAFAMVIWVIGITYLEQLNGGSGSTYFYLLPTMAALLLLTPIESTILFGFAWIKIVFIFLTNPHSYSAFGNVINSTFVTVLTIFISYRYYHSMAMEFCDRQIISSQYKEIENSNHLLQQMVHIDQLTRLNNRHYLTETLFPLFDACKEKQYYGMFLMIDIDFFKQYNDTYGHIQGDVCLKSVAEELSERCQEHGLTAIRYGGEEFLVILMAEKPIKANCLANMLLQAIWDLNLMRDDVDRRQVSVSIGLWSGNLNEVMHIEGAIKQADMALYEAKRAGRNCIVDSKQVSS